MDALLAPDEVPAVEVRQGRGAFVVVCEHASNRLPRSLGTLGLPEAELSRHIAWDPGGIELAEGIAARLSGDLVTQRFSRLIIDCNRDPALPDAITLRSEDTDIPGNAGLSSSAREARVAEIWTPFHSALEARLDARRAEHRPTALVTVHTFTPVYRGVSRPWEVGIISTDARELPEVMLTALRRDRALNVGDNEPYSSKDNVDYTIRRHGRDRGLPHVMIEVRNDLVRDTAGQGAWIDRLVGALSTFDVREQAA
jgi:predicted N-formylglutamate amidohydrolase